MQLTKIQPIEIKDQVTGWVIKIKVSPFYSVLSIDNRSYYFIKETGEFDGTSMPMD